MAVATHTFAAPSPGRLAWRRFANIPTPRSEVAAAVAGGKIYVFGGFGGRTVVERYDPQTDRWERLADLTVGLDHPMAATIGDFVLAIGGNDGSGPSARVFALQVSPETGRRWQERAPMPEPRAAAGAAVGPNGHVYVVGGAGRGGLLATSYGYDPKQDRWRRVADIPTPRDHLAVAALGDKVCAVGGRRLSMSANLGAFECYDPATDRWEKRPDLPTPRGGLGAAVLDGKLYVVGGEEPRGTFKEVEVFDGSSWSRAPDLATPRHGLAVAALGKTLFALTGGPTPGGSQSPVVEGLALP